MGKKTSDIGDVSVMEVATALRKKGYKISMPISEGLPYDIIADLNGTLIRVQCKTGRVLYKGVTFSVVSTVYEGKGVHKHRTYHGNVDAFGVYCPEKDSTYLVPFNVVKDYKASATLSEDTTMIDGNGVKNIPKANGYGIRAENYKI